VNKTPPFKIGDRVMDRALGKAGTVLDVEQSRNGEPFYVVALDESVGRNDDGRRRLGACWLAPLHAER
jgi:hypothetical protein